MTEPFRIGKTTAALSAIDEERFGMRTARASGVEAATVEPLVEYCQEQGVSMLIARCPVDDLRTVQRMEQRGFLLMDTLVYYSRDLRKTPIPEETYKVTVRPARPDEIEAVQAVAGQSFRGYYGHYHADERLDPAKCDEAYVSWAVRSVASREVADEVLVADWDGRVAGFATLRLNSPEEGEGVLFGVAPDAQGQGIYRAFMLEGMKWCLGKDRSRMVVSTQVNNYAVQKVWVRLGFELYAGYYTFHRWFD